jgi:predicted kinase
MTKITLKKPVLIMLYGFPGSGKTYFARQFAEDIGAVHLQSDKVRYELFEQPRYDRQENEIITHLMQYMAEEFLNAGLSVIYDGDVNKQYLRRQVREVAHSTKSFPLLAWPQIDIESAYARVTKRDRRKSDDKYAVPLDRKSYESYIGRMQNPDVTEDYVVISGKHNFQTQTNAVIKKLYDVGLVSPDNATAGLVKPGLVNLVPNAYGGRVDNTRRNISIK